MSPTNHLRPNDAPSPKRRKVRKGTFSCWECKHRKRRCEFGPVSNSICVYCQYRGLPCISQDVLDNTNDAYEAVERRIGNVEEIVHRLVRQQGNFTRGQSQQKLLELRRFDPTRTSSLRAIGHERLSRGPSLTGYLSSVLPAPHVILLILNSSKLHNAPLQILQSSHQQAFSTLMGESLLPDHTSSAHPITFAHRLIRLAICLREMNDSASKRTKVGLKEPIDSAARRYYETASRSVMSQDSLVASLDGLETLLLQSRYHISVGQMDTARLIFKRASHIAHLMKVHQQDELFGPRAESLLFQILYSERFMSLMLGQPFSAIDQTSAAQNEVLQSVTPQILERIHVTISERIIARNLHIQHAHRHGNIRNGGATQDQEEIESLDRDLKNAARALPTTWWIPPTTEGAETEASIMDRTAKLLLQSHQYYLLILVHQPYLLGVLRWNASQTQRNSIDQIYSKMAIVSASREVLARYLILRKLHESPSYRGLDDKALTATFALLLSHLEGHTLGSANLLEHQRPQDLGIIDCVIGCIDNLSRRNQDSQGSDRAKLLRRFVEIEADAAEGDKYILCNDAAPDDTRMNHSVRGQSHLEFDIPYFGTMHIVHQASTRSDRDVEFSTISMSNIAPEL